MEYILRKIRKGFFMAWLTFCFIILMMSLISYFFVYKTVYSKQKTQKDESIKFNTLLNQKEVKFDATWVSGDEILTRDETGNIILYDVNKSIKSILAFNSMRYVKNCYKYELSVDKKYLLIGYNVHQTSSGLFSTNYDVITVKTGKQVTLRDTNHRPRDIMATKWSPVDSSLVIVDNYNIFYIPMVAKPNHARQITFHGSEDLYHGIPDWVYREEIFRSNSAVWFSARGTKLAYARFNETLVPSANLSQHGISDTMKDENSRLFSHRYPKVNDANPTVELFVQNLSITSKPVSIQIQPTKHYLNETILYEVAWSNDEHLFVMWMNRIQNESHLVHYHIVNNIAKVKEVIEFEQENGWLDFHGSLLFSPEHQVAMVFPIENPNGQSYRQVCFIKKDGRPRPLIRRKLEVTQLIKWDFKMHEIYFIGHKIDQAEEEHLYKITTVKPYVFKCLTCDTKCKFNKVDLSENNNYYAHTCTGPKVPFVSIRKMNGDIITTWESNKKLKESLENVALPDIKYLTLRMNHGNEVRVKIKFPPKYEKLSTSKYPLLIHTHGESSLNLVLDEFKIDLGTYLCVNHKVVVAEVDSCGTSRTSSKTLFANYKKIGTDEIDEFLFIGKYLQDKILAVNEKKTCIWGWGYGGYVAGMVLAKDLDNVFNCALSVAPITDWTYHNSLFTERLMGTFKDNVERYKTASLIEQADGLRHKNYIIIHGQSDTEVHFQHSAMFSEVLRQKNIVFKQQFYPKQSHKLQNVKSHLYRTIISFILKYLG